MNFIKPVAFQLTASFILVAILLALAKYFNITSSPLLKILCIVSLVLIYTVFPYPQVERIVSALTIVKTVTFISLFTLIMLLPSK
jgi:hypothetical protein